MSGCESCGAPVRTKAGRCAWCRAERQAERQTVRLIAALTYPPVSPARRERLIRALATERRRSDGLLAAVAHQRQRRLAAEAEVVRLRGLIETSWNTCARYGGCIPRPEVEGRG